MHDDRQPLDVRCMNVSAKIAKDAQEKDADKAERAITDALGVLQSEGVYALFLFLGSRKNEACEAISKQLAQFGVALGLLSGQGELTDIRKAAENMTGYFLLGDLFERTLIYARYHAKGRG